MAKILVCVAFFYISIPNNNYRQSSGLIEATNCFWPILGIQPNITEIYILYEYNYLSSKVFSYMPIRIRMDIRSMLSSVGKSAIFLKSTPLPYSYLQSATLSKTSHLESF